VLTLALVVLLFVLVLGFLRPPQPRTTAPAPNSLAERVAAGQRALAAGKFQLAAEELDQAYMLLEQQPERRRRGESREVVQLRRQAALLADLLTEPLSEILQNAAKEQEDEWPGQFRRRYQTHAVVFDADVTRDGAGQFRLDFHVRAGPQPARIDVSDLKLLEALPRERAPRLLFGARLASIAREPPGIWVVRFDPESGVLLTDPGAVAACYPGPVDEDLAGLIQRQQEWLSDLP
jgi:hypothetical protein